MYIYHGLTLVAQTVKNLPAIWKTQVWSLGWEDPPEKERLPTQVFWPGESHGLYSPWGRKESDTTERLSLSTFPQGTKPYDVAPKQTNKKPLINVDCGV